MDLKELGRLLKEERLRQGLDLAEVMEKTKISRVSLEAIEEGNERALPHPVYAKGFVKNYARFLGLDADKIGNSLAQVYSSEEVPAHEEELALTDARKLPPVKSQWPRQLGLLALAALLVAFLAGAWFFRAPLQGAFVSVLELVGFLSKPAPEAVREPESAPGIGLPFGHGDAAFPDQPPVSEPFAPFAGDPLSPLMLPVETPEGEPDNGIAVEPSLEGEEGAGQDADAPSSPAQPAPVASTPTEPASTAEAEPAAIPVAPAVPTAPEAMAESRTADDGATQGERTLEIRAFANCWLSAQADGGRVREAFLRPGERLVVSFEKFLDLKLGNAGGVELFLDGKPWPLRARSGEVLALRLP